MALSLGIVRKKTGLWLLTVTDVDGVAVNLTGMALYFHAAGIVDIDKSTVAGGITVTSAVGGLATLQLDPADTASVPTTGTYSIPCELTLVNGALTYGLSQGNLIINQNVGEP